jgi:hypothetical protein
VIWGHGCWVTHSLPNGIILTTILSYGRLSLSRYPDAVHHTRPRRTPNSPTCSQLTDVTRLLQPRRAPSSWPAPSSLPPVRPRSLPPSLLRDLHCDPALPSDPAPSSPGRRRGRRRRLRWGWSFLLWIRALLLLLWVRGMRRWLGFRWAQGSYSLLPPASSKVMGQGLEQSGPRTHPLAVCTPFCSFSMLQGGFLGCFDRWFSNIAIGWFKCCRKEVLMLWLLQWGDFNRWNNLFKILQHWKVILSCFPFSCFMADFATLQYYYLRCCST